MRFSVSFAEFLRTLTLKNIYKGLLQKISNFQFLHRFMLFELQSYLNLNVASKKQEGSSRQAKENTAATKIFEAFLVSR